ncbi:hypothetical protein AWV79_20245 [Cupriavidus sp. UYMMa02A]|nr:hypothetical protein AWV79_20245 [Cupriavidus sp. UYMMa02A]
MASVSCSFLGQLVADFHTRQRRIKRLAPALLSRVARHLHPWRTFLFMRQRRCSARRQCLSFVEEQVLLL